MTSMNFNTTTNFEPFRMGLSPAITLPCSVDQDQSPEKQDKDEGNRLEEPVTNLDKRGTGHGMLNAGKVASRKRIALRHVMIKLLGKLPGTRFKSRLFARLFGIKMGKDVGIAYGSYLDPYDPSMITFGDNVIVGYEAKIFVHMFTLTRQRIKPVKVGNNVIIGACSIIAPGVTIGDNASIAPGTIVSRNVPAGALVKGNPMQITKRHQ